jgi:hypothetical protein
LNATLLANANDKKKRHAQMRFEAFLDPVNNWVVWDTKEQYFAEVGTRYLMSLPEERAKAFCTMLNILFSRDAELLTTDTVECVVGASTITRLTIAKP